MADQFDKDEDKNLFSIAMTGVKPLKTKSVVPSSTAQTTRLKKQTTLPFALPKSRSISHLPPISAHTRLVFSETLLAFCHPSLSSKQWRQLKSGQMPRQGQLDLHHLRADEAAQALTEFIIHHQDRGHRSVLIIHGKGGYHGEAPILKNHVNQWLRENPNVLAFHSAQSKDGGNGALYVLIRKP